MHLLARLAEDSGHAVRLGIEVSWKNKSSCSVTAQEGETASDREKSYDQLG